MRLLRKSFLIIYALILIGILTSVMMRGCTSSNEDPTNMELEVLRATLLEKELLIDELRNTMDDYIELDKTKDQALAASQQALDDEVALNQSLIEGKLQVDETGSERIGKLFAVEGDNLYLLNRYHDSEYQFVYDILIKYSNQRDVEVFYMGDSIEFDIDPVNQLIFILDQSQLLIYDYDGNQRYSYITSLTNPLNTPVVHLAYSQKVFDSNVSDGRLYLMVYEQVLTKEILRQIVAIDYSDLGSMVVEQMAFEDLVAGDEVVFDPTTGQIYYTNVMEDGRIGLYRGYYKSSIETLITTNDEMSFNLYIEDNRVHYFSEENNEEKTILLY